MNQKFFENYFLFFFSLIPISIIIGPAVSLFSVIAISLSSFFILPKIYKQGHNIFLSKTVDLIFLYLIFLSENFSPISPILQAPSIESVTACKTGSPSE